jgi:hypothetical protein
MNHQKLIQPAAIHMAAEGRERCVKRKKTTTV